jgi:hypothetical protein
MLSANILSTRRIGSGNGNGPITLPAGNSKGEEEQKHRERVTHNAHIQQVETDLLTIFDKLGSPCQELHMHR